jgi:hypothetical protein
MGTILKTERLKEFSYFPHSVPYRAVVMPSPLRTEIEGHWKIIN